MEIEERLDEDFLFYLQFVSLQKLPQGTQYDVCQSWLRKLCGETCQTIEAKRDRNIYLSNLVLQMEQAVFNEPFISMPTADKLDDATEIFGLQGPTIKMPDWITEVVGKDDTEELTSKTTDARTYLATKYLPGGRGAMGYIAVSLDDEPLQFKKKGFDAHLGSKFDEMIPPLSEMEKILIKRNNPEERERVIKYYETVVKNIARQIDGRSAPRSNTQIEDFLKQLEADLKQKGKWCRYAQMDDEHRYLELLIDLDMHIQERLAHIKNREDFLDDVESNTLRQSFFETSLQPEDIFKESKGSRACRMWQQAIEAGPSQNTINKINAKETLAIKIQRRHENLVSQLKKEMRKEGEKGKTKYDETKVLHDKIVAILDNIKDYDKRAFESEKLRKEALYGHTKERDMVYEEIRRAMIEAHQHATEEAQIGCYLSQQINAVNEQNQIYDQINEESILKIEDANIETMKNIRRLTKLVKQHEHRIANVRSMMERTQTLEQGSEFLFI